MDGRVETLIHLEIDTVKMNGECFSEKVKPRTEGQQGRGFIGDGAGYDFSL